MNECVCGCGVDHGTATISIRVCFDLRYGNHHIPARAQCRARASARAVRLAAILIPKWGTLGRAQDRASAASRNDVLG
jgi:hypothetical protein